MHFQIQNLDRGTSGMLPEHCRACGWWQGHDDGWPSNELAVAWKEVAAEHYGYWGKLAVGDDTLLGFIQFGPAHLFSRAEEIAGDDIRDSFLLACHSVAETDIVSLGKSLLVALLSELRLEEDGHVDAFCSVSDAGSDCRLFDSQFLNDCGFYPVRQIGDLVMMRLELGGLQPTHHVREKARHRLLDRIKRRSSAPSPAAMCSRHEGADAPVSS